MAAGGARILKIDVQVDESGEARRNLAGVESGVQKVEAAGNKSGGALSLFNKNLAGTSTEAESAAESVTGANAAFAAATPILGTGAVAIAGYTVAILGATVAVSAIAELIRRSSEYYIEQSGVLEVNREAVDRLKVSWDAVRFTIGEATVGNSANFSGWIDFISENLIRLGVNFATDIALAKELIGLVARAGNPAAAVFGESAPGPATARRDFGGNLTAAGDLALFQENEKKRLAAGRLSLGKQPTGEEAERLLEEDMRRRTRQVLGQIHDEEEAMKAAERAAKALKLEQFQLFEAFRRVRDSAREAFNAEISNAFMSNLKSIKASTQGIRDDFAGIALSGIDAVTGLDKLKQFQIAEKATRAIADVDPRAENSDAVLQQIEARRQLSLLMLKKDTEGVTDELQQQFLIFRQTYEDVLGGLPVALEEAVPGITSASGEIRDVMTNDISAIGAHAEQTFSMMATVLHKTSADLMAEATAITNDLADMVSKGQQGPFGYRMFQEQAAQRHRDEAAFVAIHEQSGAWGLPGFADGVRNFRGGFAMVGERGPEVVRLPGGSDVFPSGRSGGVTFEAGSIVVQVTGGDDRAAEEFADKIQQKLAPLFTRYGG